MTLKDINLRTRQFLRDTNKTIFEEMNVNNGINEAIDRVKSIRALTGMKHLVSPDDEPLFLPEEYHYLLAIFSASRCFFQDEMMQQSITLMNEFETKLFELKTGIENGDIVVTDPDGNIVDNNAFYKIDAIKDVYFEKRAVDGEVIRVE